MVNVNELLLPDITREQKKQASIKATQELFKLVVTGSKDELEQYKPYDLDLSSNDFFSYRYDTIHIKIYDPETKCRLMCIYNMKDYSIKYDVETNYLDNELVKHRDFNAKEFKRLSLEYFDNKKLPINKMISIYKTWSDNYKQFMEIYDKTLDNKIEAINGTWSARNNKYFGFGIINKDSIVIEPGEIRAYFIKTLAKRGEK